MGAFHTVPINPPTNLGDQLAQAVQLRTLAGQQQLQQIQIQNAQADSRAYQAANQQWKPNQQGQYDHNDFIDLMRKNGATPQTVLSLQQAQLKMDETAALARRNNLEAAAQQNKIDSDNHEKIAGDLENLKPANTPPEQYEAARDRQLQQWVRDKKMTSDEASQYSQVPQSAVEGLQKHILGLKTYADVQKAQADTEKANQQALEAKMKAGTVDVDTENQRATERYQQYHPNKALPTYLTLPQGANRLQLEQRDKSLEALEKAEATKQNTAATREATATQRGITNEMAKQRLADERERLQMAQTKAQEPTADEQRRADLARNMNENLDQVEDLVTRRPDLFGPLAGRLTHLRSAVGTTDPDIAKLGAVKEYLGMASVGAHAMRNAQHVETAANAILNNFNNSPTAIKAAIDSARKSTATFLQDERRRKNKALDTEAPTTIAPAEGNRPPLSSFEK